LTTAPRVSAFTSRSIAIVSPALYAIIVVLAVPKGHLALLGYARVIAARFEDNAFFPGPVAWLQEVLDAIEAFSDACVAMRTLHGMKGHRDEKRRALKAALGHLRDSVQLAAEQSSELCEAIVESAGMKLKGRRAPGKAAFAVKRGRVAGSARCVARRVGTRATYFWEMSEDGASWVRLRDTLQASTAVGGLTVGRTYYFRFRSLCRRVTSDYSDTVAFLAT
jgi:hypothetical protein